MLVVIPIAITVVMIYVIIMSFKAAQGKKRPNDREIIIPEQVDSLPDSTIKSNPSFDDAAIGHSNHHSGSHHHSHHSHHHHSGVNDSHHHSDSHHSSHDVGGSGGNDSWSGSDSSSSDFSSPPSMND
ncbi:MAG TPA: hypothetical protein VL443_03360 [Cyclobacteriaceae bacterium]|jgi:hypothetical protein|nr:hypothetical protein [Cyclobacteriaceae bacterium]